LYENEYVFAFLDINPLSKGHTLLVSKEPAPSIDHLSQDSAAAIGKALPILSRAIKEATGAIAYNIIQNNGREAGMTVPHVHFHIIPKYKESKHVFTWEPKALDATEGKSIADAIQLSLNE
jgi:histidine triad (HIT) family protein